MLQVSLADIPFARRARYAAPVVAAFALGVLIAGQQAALAEDEPEVKKKPAPSADDAQVEPRAEEGKESTTEANLPKHPFPRRIPAPSFGNELDWLNTAGPLDVKDLQGKFVLLDFWTYCCINCMHILPELKKLEHKYADELVVIGVHSAKFDTEKQTENIREAILRYEIEHPVVNDAEQQIWDKYFVRSWPSLRVIDPEGNIVAGHSGEITFEALDAFLQGALPYYEKKGVLDRSPLRFDLEAEKARETPLRYPGKLLADKGGDRLFVADSNHNRIVIASLDGKLLEVIGTGQIGSTDGGYDEARFDHPQGMALRGDTLYVADTENHLLRKIDLKKKTVATIAGTGKQARGGWPGMEQFRTNPSAKLPQRWVGKPSRTAINSPWALLVHEGDLYIAMAGPHQIWKMPLDESEIGPYAGNGREDIVDGPLLPPTPYEQGYSAFAQPSGLASDGRWLYVADSEGSSIRAVPFDPEKKVRTIVGTANMPGARLFLFGDRDGKGLLRLDVPAAQFRGDAEQTAGPLLQHALGVVHHEGKLYITDTYNNKLKSIDLEAAEVKTLAGTGEPGTADDPAQFDEPAGVSYAGGKLYVADTNNHLIRVVDLASNHRVSTLRIEGLTPPEPPEKSGTAKPSFPGAKQVKVDTATLKPAGGEITLQLALELPIGWKINPIAPQTYYIEATAAQGPIDRSALGQLVQSKKKAPDFTVTLPARDQGEDTLKVTLQFFYCQEGAEGLCKVGAVTWTVPIDMQQNAKASSVRLEHRVLK